MFMKTFILVVLLAGVGKGVMADQAADSFGTGFANALQRAMENKQQEERHEAQSEVVAAGHYDVRDNYGQPGNLDFATFSQCEDFLTRNSLYKSCFYTGK